MPNIGIIGLGHVGSRLHHQLENVAHVTTYDVRDGDSYPHAKLSECDLTMVCVGTPELTGQGVDIQNVVDAVEACPTELVLIRSTVMPGTTDALQAHMPDKRLVYCPEYVGETRYIAGSWDVFEKTQPFFVLGGSARDCQDAADILTELYGPLVRHVLMGARDAEWVKLMENAYFAAKVTFCNEMFDLITRDGANWTSVREGWLADPRVERDHSAVFEKNRGYSGRCLPKDMHAVLMTGLRNAVDTPMLTAVAASNERHLAKVK